MDEIRAKFDELQKTLTDEPSPADGSLHEIRKQFDELQNRLETDMAMPSLLPPEDHLSDSSGITFVTEHSTLEQRQLPISPTNAGAQHKLSVEEIMRSLDELSASYRENQNSSKLQPLHEELQPAKDTVRKATALSISCAESLKPSNAGLTRMALREIVKSSTNFPVKITPGSVSVQAGHVGSGEETAGSAPSPQVGRRTKAATPVLSKGRLALTRGAFFTPDIKRVSETSTPPSPLRRSSAEGEDWYSQTFADELDEVAKAAVSIPQERDSNSTDSTEFNTTLQQTARMNTKLQRMEREVDERLAQKELQVQKLNEKLQLLSSFAEEMTAKLTTPVTAPPSPKAAPLTPTEATSNWDRDEDHHACRMCARTFTFSRRRHHCRSCGHIFCSKCAPGDNVQPVPSKSLKKPVRHCLRCFRHPHSRSSPAELLEGLTQQITILKMQFIASQDPTVLVQLSHLFSQSHEVAKNVSPDAGEAVVIKMQQFFKLPAVRQHLVATGVLAPSLAVSTPVVSHQRRSQSLVPSAAKNSPTGTSPHSGPPGGFPRQSRRLRKNNTAPAMPRALSEDMASQPQ